MSSFIWLRLADFQLKPNTIKTQFIRWIDLFSNFGGEKEKNIRLNNILHFACRIGKNDMLDKDQKQKQKQNQTQCSMNVIIPNMNRIHLACKLFPFILEFVCDWHLLVVCVDRAHLVLKYFVLLLCSFISPSAFCINWKRAFGIFDIGIERHSRRCITPCCESDIYYERTTSKGRIIVHFHVTLELWLII